MPNLFQNLIESSPYETLKRVQGDKKELPHGLPWERIGVKKQDLLIFLTFWFSVCQDLLRKESRRDQMIGYQEGDIRMSHQSNMG